PTFYRKLTCDSFTVGGALAYRKSNCDNCVMVDRTNPDRQVRGAKLRTLVLDATIARIEAVGIDNVRIADIAEAAGVHETSLYRRWKTLSRLLVDALVSRTAEEIPIPDTGSVESDLETFTADLARFAQTPAGTAMIRSTVV
ncbi:TetR/AcrR family transcriptional regulator, partial [Microtetraspora sp. AC03309]|uniref:TetR/AcrR family transcriptional regulator n=1 Tax=Microtetraspora sp. AC03309 TaxID=2779376 RepID=UPI001E5EB87E